MSYQAPHPIEQRAYLSPVTVDELLADPTCAKGLTFETVSELLAEIASRESALRTAHSAIVSMMAIQHTAADSGNAVGKLPMTNGKPTLLEAPIPPVCKPYLSINELARLTPWTDQAIRTMMSKGILRERAHFFYVGRRPVFKWTAIVAFIERPDTRDPVPHYRDQLSDGAKA
jgi:hypothetical protein